MAIQAQDLDIATGLIPRRAATPGGIGKAMDFVSIDEPQSTTTIEQEAIGCGSGNGDKMAGDFDIGHR